MSLGDVFDKVREDSRAAFIGHCPAGFPTTDKSIENIKVAVDVGASIIEVGLPFSDPMIDGPTTRDTANVALDASFRTRKIMRVVHKVTEHDGTCVAISYWNSILQCGPERSVEGLAATGGRGTIIPGIIPEEVGQQQHTTKANDLSNIILVAPPSTNGHLQLTTTTSTGFVYAISHMGVTDAQASIDSAAGKSAAHAREVTDTPVCVGSGVSSGEQAAEIAEFVDNAIAGSVLIKVTTGSTDDLVALTHELAADAWGEN